MIQQKFVRHSPSYNMIVPSDVSDDYDERVSSFWRDGESLALQLSSYLRSEGQQLPAMVRLDERMRKHSEDWVLWVEKLHPDPDVDQATAEYLDTAETLWVHTYLVWPHLTLYALVSGPMAEVRQPKNWAMEAIKSVKLTMH